jgi:hypothetical protein
MRLPKLSHERPSRRRSARPRGLAALRARRDALAAQRAAGELISLARLVGRPVRDLAGKRLGTVDDVAVSWTEKETHPPVTGIIVRVGQGLVFVAIDGLDLHHDRVVHRTPSEVVNTPTRHPGDVALRRDVLDRQLIDVAGAQVVRAADLYIAVTGGLASLVGVDVGLRAYLRRVLPAKRPAKPSPAHMIDWAELVAFVPRSGGDDTGEATPSDPASAPTAAAGAVGGAVRLSVGAHELHTLSADELTSLMQELGRSRQGGLVASARPSAAAAALSSLTPAARDALLAQLDTADQRRLRSLVKADGA